ncbi:phosphate acetyltransferase [Pediococcus ethanolidurans]|uniref:phosphate acetyltransferase n=1 Tax=Pediococcus ethanolidurans TaxID=319653 RepID=UPI001C1EAF2A|nr:phosphate acetyltransferase [Pediococcus ethanolidurans]MBU7554013.1 phosphate acetyltransferase [Pediococcus ethanolidurans]MBU7563148.1 phosphate acetyltransferase [Pediococcus ethanolidurans]MCT4398240.1 phosphate acetyltransferase [Pediococcus ethanolidurans]MCV3314982.1 phosphate acetyltransferase [Pediococcus ethanolidurans]MCV3322072.1 phosphate acetyltransferase [Pediococcus ethanolidurans]
MDLFEGLKAKIKGQDRTVVFPEGEDVRIYSAASRLAQQGLVKPILLGKVTAIQEKAAKEDIDLAGIKIIDPDTYPETDKQAMVDALVERRKGKNTVEEVQKMLMDVNYFGTMLVYLHKADAMVSGAIHPTGDTVRPALQIIKTKPGVKRISGAFVMQRNHERYIFADTAINIDPDAATLAEIAVESAHTAEIFDIEPKVAMLSFSTKGSAKGDMVAKVQEATKLAQEKAPEVEIDGELQFDAAFVPDVGASKAPGSKVAGHATVFVFPELQSGNIGYKIAQRLGHFEAIGPILQGLNAPVSDLSRGASEEDVYKVAIMTAAQVR